MKVDTFLLEQENLVPMIYFTKRGYFVPIPTPCSEELHKKWLEDTHGDE